MNAMVFTPRQLATRWAVSERHVRNLIRDGKLRYFRVGGKLLRIPLAEVEAFECQTIASDGSEADLSSSTGETDSGTVTRLAPMTHARLNLLRQRFTPN